MDRHVPGIRRRLACEGLVAAAVIALALPVSALAANGTRLEYDLQFEGSIDCGTFTDDFTDFYHVREVDELDEAGNLLRVTYQAEHHSNDVNSVTGLTIHEHGHFHEVDDFVAGTYTITGAQEVGNRRGTGVVIQDTGRLVLDADFEPIFFAGGRKHSQVLLGEQIWCDALS